ncbi:MAG: FAD-binding protein, partial [Gemmatimonadota bacterium]
GGRGLAVCGALALAKDGTEEEGFGLVLFNARNVVLATGGPGGMYRDSVYPQSQRGSTGMALRIGAVAQNLTESQFGMASLGFRWNLSGSYQQVVPRYLSTDPDGGGEREFLNDPFPDMKTLASAVFRKGYEWPFDADRVEGFGSSLIDLLVHREARSGRRVFLDFTRDPQGGDGLEPFTLEVLDEEARAYLRNSGALGDSPVERLIAMNRPAFQLFLDNGIDLRTDRLEIAVCAQHNNGGLRAGIWWESNVHNLFPIGEVCGTHGVRRPGGAALNAGQVGGWRAARYIAAHYREAPPSPEAFTAIVGGQVEECLSFCDSVLTPKGVGSRLTPAQVISEVQDRMTLAGAQIRGPALVAGEKEKARRLLLALPERLRIRETRALGTAFWAADLALTHLVYLEAIHGYLQAGGGSRGSALVLDNQGEVPSPALGDRWRFRRADLGGRTEQEILEVWLEGPAEVATCWVPVRPLPAGEGWFEEVWREFREGRVLR